MKGSRGAVAYVAVSFGGQGYPEAQAKFAQIILEHLERTVPAAFAELPACVPSARSG